MLAKALVIAMAADIARSDYAKPTLIRSRGREWLIACRWGPDGEYLSIATAGPLAEPLAPVARFPPFEIAAKRPTRDRQAIQIEQARVSQMQHDLRNATGQEHADRRMPNRPIR